MWGEASTGHPRPRRKGAGPALPNSVVLFYLFVNHSLVASTMSSSTSTSTKYNRTKLHNLEHFAKILGFTEMHRVSVKHT